MADHDDNKHDVNNEGLTGVDSDSKSRCKVLKIDLDDESRWVQTMFINGRKLNARLDTGAGANLISKLDFDALPNRPPLSRCSVRLKAYTGHAIQVLGQCELTCVVDKEEFVVNFIVISEGTTILGYAACERLDLVRRIKRVMAVQRRADQHQRELGDPDVKDCLLPEVSKNFY